MSVAAARHEELRIVADHMLVQRDGLLYIIDTGVPASMPCPAVVSDVLGLPVAGLIGCEEIAGSVFRIDWPRRTVSHDAPPAPEHVAVSLGRTPFGLPTIPVRIEGITFDAVLDAGAALSFVPPDLVRGLVPHRHAEDFLPGFGSFPVDVFGLQASVGGLSFSLEVGVLPPLLQLSLGLLCPDGLILGAALFRDRVVTLDLANSVAHLSLAAPRGRDA